MKESTLTKAEKLDTCEEFFSRQQKAFMVIVMLSLLHLPQTVMVVLQSPDEKGMKKEVTILQCALAGVVLGLLSYTSALWRRLRYIEHRRDRFNSMKTDLGGNSKK